ncbi:hypothetical protein Y032_0701g1645 [Ancylostoma ceylanicum]|nr:hypothetical protein Y032_0701g1645 [Ancylostoma ceylanicum]
MEKHALREPQRCWPVIRNTTHVKTPLLAAEQGNIPVDATVYRVSHEYGNNTYFSFEEMPSALKSNSAGRVSQEVLLVQCSSA